MSGTLAWQSRMHVRSARRVGREHAPIMMTVLDWTPVSPGIGAAARATMNGYTASTLLVKKNLRTGRNRVLPSYYPHRVHRGACMHGAGSVLRNDINIISY